MLGQQCCDMLQWNVAIIFNQSTHRLRDYAFSGAFLLVMGSWPPLNFILSRKIQSRTMQSKYGGIQRDSDVQFCSGDRVCWRVHASIMKCLYDARIICPPCIFTKMGFWKKILTNLYFTTRTFIFTCISHLFLSKTSVFLVYRSSVGSKVALSG